MTDALIDHTSPIWGPICNGDAKAIAQFIAQGTPVDSRLHGGNATFLHNACSNGHEKVVRLLIDSGADLNARTKQFSETPLMLAAQEGHVAPVLLLLDAGADLHLQNQHGLTALALAARRSKRGAKVAEALVKAGARADARAMCNSARENGSPEMIRLLAAAGGDVNDASWNCIPLFEAIQEKRPDNVAALLELGADPNLQAPATNPYYGGKTPLELALELKLSKIIPLLEAGADGKKPGAKKSSVKKSPPKSKPPTAADIPALWERIKAALKQRGPKVLKALQRGATEAQLKKLEKTCDCKLPPDFRAAYQLHNGQKPASDPLFPAEFPVGDYELLPLDGILREWNAWNELADSGEFKGQKSAPEKGIRSDWWHPGWIPFAANGGGDSICLDLAPAKGGAIGQVITMNHDSPERLVLAKSLAEYLGKLAEHWEQ